MSHDGLIPHPCESASLSRCVVVLFLLLTGGAGVWDLLAAPATAQVAGREGERLQQEREAALIADGTWMRTLDDDLARRSNLKSVMDPWYAAILLRGLNEASDDIHVGRDGWLFLAARAERPQVSADAVAKTWARALAAMDRHLKRRGGRMLVMPVPRRSVACGTLLPEGIEPDFGLESALHDELENEGLARIDLRIAFAGRTPKELWYREDTHWNRTAQWLAASAVRAAHGSQAEPDSWADDLHEMVNGPDMQGLLRYLNIEPRSAAREWLLVQDTSPALLPLDPTLRNALGPKDAPIALVGTSFSVGEGFLAYLRLQGTTPVYNSARRGFPVGAGLARYSQMHRDVHETILVEAPLHQLLPSQAERTEPVFANGQLQFLTTIQGRNGPTLTRPGAWSVVPNTTPGRTIHLPAHQLLTTGDGVALARVERPESGTGDWVVHVTIGELTWTSDWSADRPVLHVPLLDIASRADEVRIQVRGPGATSLDAAATRVVMEHDLTRAVQLDAESGEHDSLRRTRTFAWPGQGVETRDAALLYRQGPWRGDVRIELLPEDGGAAVPIADAVLHEWGQAVLDLSAFRDGSWTGIRVTTEVLDPSTSDGTPPPFQGRDRADSMAIVPLEAP